MKSKGKEPHVSTAAANKEQDKRKQQLITMGKAKGFLTYDEVNDHLPEDVISSDQIDDFLSTLGEAGIEIVDGSAQIKVPPATTTTVAAISVTKEVIEVTAEKEEEEEEEEEEDFDGGYSKTNDPVRMYLRKMGSVSLLTREGEVEIAKRIEEGERRVLQVVLNSPIAVEELIEVGNRVKAGKMRIKDVVRDVDEEDAEYDEAWHTERVVKIIEKVKRAARENEKLVPEIENKKTPEIRRKKARERVEENKQEMFDQLTELRINKKQIEKIVQKLKALVVRIEKADSEAYEVEKRIGLTWKDLKKTLTEAKSSPQKARAIEKKLGLTADELVASNEEIGEAKKRVKRVEEEAKSSVDDLRRTYKEIHEG